ncbi:L-lactate MFS transporter [Enterococcus sp. LJL128]|uniref:L-lactate MFS transporter n=1 Tax=Enterococcus sp. LJL51 TaxID=3416656 RepID=UPI003CEC931F
MKQVKNRWLIAASGIAVHLSIGSAYAWSIYTKPIAELTGWEQGPISFAFSIAIFCLGVSAAFMGKFVEKFGPRKTGTVASIMFGSGIILTGVAVNIQSLPLLYLAYGIIGGIGLGAGYVTPVSTMIRWFPDRRGLATGMAIMGFGFASLITGPIAQKLMLAVGIPKTFYILGACYFAVMFIASQYLEKPPVDWRPAGYEESNEKQTKNHVKLKEDYSQLAANEAIKTKRFWLLWFMLFINITCGIALVSAASPMAQEITGMSAAMAAAMVGIMGLFNGGGRLFWATLSDYIGRPNVFTAIFIIDVIALTALYFFSSPILFAVLICIIMTCYGAGFSVIPAYIGDVFGTKELGAIHGYILTAWAAAGMVGPLLLSFVHETFKNYNTTLLIFIAFCLIALTLSILIRSDLKKAKAN